MPAARLQPLPFLGPSRLLDLIEQDPGLLAPEVRIVARRLPLPHRASGVVLDALGRDAADRCVLLRAVERISPRVLEETIAARAWFVESWPALKALRPDIGDAASEMRSLILAAEIDEAARPFVDLLRDGSGLDVVLIRAFDGPSGLAVSAERLPAPGRGRSADVRSPAPPLTHVERASGPLTGMALTPEEIAEFRSLATVAPHAPRVSAAEPRAAAFAAIAEPRGALLEN